MKRRSFFAALLAAPFIPYAAKAASPAKAPFFFKDGVLHLNEVKIDHTSSTLLRPNPVVDQAFEEKCHRPMVSILKPDGSVELVPRLHRKVILQNGTFFEEV